MLHAVIILSVLAARGCHAAANSSTSPMKQTTSKPTAAPPSRQPAPSSRQPTPYSRQPAPSSRQPAPYSRQLAPSSRQPAPYSRQLAPSSRQPAPYSRQPAPVAALVQAARRSPSDLLVSLRRQLMRDNYDYQNANTDDELPKERQKVGSKNHSYVLRTAKEQVSSNAQLKANTHQFHNTQKTRTAQKPKVKQKTAFRHNPIAPGRALEWHNPYDATYSSDTRVPPGPSYSPDRANALYPHQRHGEPARDEPDSQPGPVVRAGVDRDQRYPLTAPDASEEDADVRPVAVQHPYELPSKSVEAQDSRSVQKHISAFGGQKQFGINMDGVKPDKSRQRPVQRSEPIDHPIAKKDLLYYMDDVHLRRNNDVSAELYSDADEAPYGHSHARHHAGRSRRAGPDTHSETPNPPNPEKLNRSSVVEPNLSTNVVRFAAVPEQHLPADASVVSLSDSSSEEYAAASGEPASAAAWPAAGEAQGAAGANATYKVLKVRARHAARRAGGARRLLEERGADGVALIRLDGAPFPQFRLPRARRQYMRDHLHEHLHPR